MFSIEGSDKCSISRYFQQRIGHKDKQLPIIFTQSCLTHERGLITRPILIHITSIQQTNNGFPSRPTLLIILETSILIFIIHQIKICTYLMRMQSPQQILMYYDLLLAMSKNSRFKNIGINAQKCVLQLIVNIL